MSSKERCSPLGSLSRFAIPRSSRSPRARRFQSPALLAPSETSLVIHSDQDLIRDNKQQPSCSLSTRDTIKKSPRRMKPRHKAIVCRDPLYQQRVRIVLGQETEAELGEQKKSLCWRYKKFRAEIGKPSIDSRFAHLPVPYANKLICRDPIKDKIRRQFIVVRKALSSSRWRRKKKEYRRFSCAMPRLDIDENTEREEPRFCPQILPHGHRVERVLLDKFHDPPAGDYARYYEHSKGKRNKRDHRFYVQENRRRMDGDVLKYHSRIQINDWLIGRPPPLPTRLHTEIQLHRLNRENMPMWKQAEMLAQIPPTPVTPEVDPVDIVPTESDYSFIWDRAMLSRRRKFGEHLIGSIELADMTPKNDQRCNDHGQEDRRDSLTSTAETSVESSELRSGEISVLDVSDRMNETPKSDDTIRESRMVVQPLSLPPFGSITRRDTLTEGEGLLENESKEDSEETIIFSGDHDAYPPMPTRPPPEVPNEIVLVRPYKMKAMQKTYRESIVGGGKLALIRTSTDSSTESFPELRDLWTNSPAMSESPGADSNYLLWQPEKSKDVRRHKRRDSSMRFPVIPNSSSMMGGVELRQRHQPVKSTERPVISPFSSSIEACEDFSRFPSVRKSSQGGLTPSGAKERRGRFPVAVNSGTNALREFGASRKNSLNTQQGVENGGSMKHVRHPSVLAGAIGRDLSSLSVDDFDFRSPQLPPPIPPRSPMRTAALRPLILGHASQSPLNRTVDITDQSQAEFSVLESNSNDESEGYGDNIFSVDISKAEDYPTLNRPPTPMFGLGIELGRKRGYVAPAAESLIEQISTTEGQQATIDQSLVITVLDKTTPSKPIPPVPKVDVQKEAESTPKTPVKTPGKLTIVWPPVNSPGARATSPSSSSTSTSRNLAINVIPATPEIPLKKSSTGSDLTSPSPASRGRAVSLVKQILDTYEDSAEKFQIEKGLENQPNSCANSDFLGEQGVLKLAHRTTSKAQKLPWILRAEQQKAADHARQAAFEKEQHEYISEMESKLLRPVEVNSVKSKAEQDAKQMHQAVMAECAKTGKPPPPYGLTELIGKGTFGRVYKAKDFNTAGIVAVKIIDIDESDTLNPRNADALSDFMKEVNALKKLSESKARNINHVIEALPVGKAMWMITDYCGGGSVATLMKPTAPGGLVEKYIITIVREVAEAVGWVHAADIIHRDIKCANVLVTEQGGVQLCDFGVAGMIENKIDKRSTIIGTPHWMAPELFDPQPNYGKEVDIWAFGSLVYEVATGWPPNVSNGIPYQQLGSHLRQHTPRLEGGDYSDGLRDLVAYCLEELPSARPTIQQVQQHAYIANTSGRYPTSSLSQLVKAFREWEERGGSRKSLFMAGGAQGPSESNTAADDEWNFGTASSFDLEVSQRRSTQDLREAMEFTEETKRPKGSRRRPPPAALSRLPPPLVKVFDPNTLSSYQDNVKNRYYPDDNRPPQTSDLPFRNDSMNNEVNDRVSMIDLGGHDPTTGISHFPSMDTLKPGVRRIDEEIDDYNSTLHDFSRPALSDPADVNPNRRTQDWKFPSMIPPASADPEVSRFPTSYEVPRPAATPSTSGRPALVHHPTEPLGASFGGGLLGAGQPALDRRSIAESLIDLDMSLPDTFDLQRPSTANSDVGSTTSEQMGSENPFALDNRISYQAPVTDSLEPSLYVTEDTPPPPERSESTRDINEISDFSASEAEGPDPNLDPNDATRYDSQGFSDTDYISMPPPPRPSNTSTSNGLGEYSMSHFPALVDPPSKAALDGTASRAEMVSEVTRVLGSMTAQLEAFRDVYGEESGLRRGPGSRRRQQ